MTKEHVYVANIASDMINQRLDLCCIAFTVHPVKMLPFIFQQFHGLFQGLSGVGKGVVVTHGIDVLPRFFLPTNTPDAGYDVMAWLKDRIANSLIGNTWIKSFAKFFTSL